MGNQTSKVLNVKKTIAHKLEDMFPHLSHSERVKMLIDFYESKNRNGNFYIVKTIEQLKLIYPHMKFTLEELKGYMILANNRIQDRLMHVEYESILDTEVAKYLSQQRFDFKAFLETVTGTDEE
jgi:hypothetical protein